MESILTSIKKVLGIAADYDHFDVDLIMHINSVFMILTQMGVGPQEGFSIMDEDAVWSDFTQNKRAIESVKSYMFMKVRLLFDSTSLTSPVIAAMERQIAEFEWRLHVAAESGDFSSDNSGNNGGTSEDVEDDNDNGGEVVEGGLYESWDFTKSRVSDLGTEAVLGTYAGISSFGLRLNDTTEAYATLSEYTSDIVAVEIDIADMEYTLSSSSNGRVVMTAQKNADGTVNTLADIGFMWKKSDEWSVNGLATNSEGADTATRDWAANTDILTTQQSVVNSTLRLELLDGATILYKNGVKIATFNKSIGCFGRVFQIGSSGSSFRGMTITGFRTYK